MTHFTLRFLGQFHVDADNSPVTGFHSDKARALLAYLAIEPQEHSRSTLATLLWPEIGDKYARTNLRNTLYRLRQTLDEASAEAGDQLLTVTRQTVAFNKDAADVDVLRFQSLLADAQPTATNHTQLEDATALYRGELLTGFNVADAPVFEEWLLLHREFLHQQALLTLHTLVTAFETAGQYERAHSIANRLLTLDPYREETHRQIMRLLAIMKHSDQALQQLERLRQLLQDELGAEPAAETLALAKQIAAGEFDHERERQEKERQEKERQEKERQEKERQGKQDNDVPDASIPTIPSSPPAPAAPTLDLRDIPDPGPFFGREQEYQQIVQWLLTEQSRVIAILGIGGMGKTTLAAQSLREMASRDDAPHFDAIFWRSLVNAPPLEELLPSILQSLSEQQLVAVPRGTDEQLRLLFGYLREKRVLLVLDNAESILSTERAGTYRPGYEPYGQLIQQMASLDNQSHLLLTSRERPHNYARLEKDGYAVQSLQLTGLDGAAAHQLLKQRGVLGNRDEGTMLITRYSGNPLALKLIADTVDEIFGGNIAEFLREESLVFDDIRIVLDQHFDRLNELEQQVLFWLAIEREPMAVARLRELLLTPPPQHLLIETLRNLQRRSLVERTEQGFALQNVVTEYLTERLLDAVVQEILREQPAIFHLHALLTTGAKEYVRESQRRLFLAPIGQRLLAQIDRHELAKRLQQLLDALRRRAGIVPSYVGGNVLNLLLHLEIPIDGYNFSRLAIRQAVLQRATLHGVNFTAAEFSDVLFTDDFGFVFSIAISPDGELLAAATDNGDIHFWRWSDRQLVAVCSGHTNRALSVTFSPDGKLLVSSGMDQTVRIWDVQTQTAVKILRGHTGAVRNVAISPDGNLLASCSQDHTVRVWDLQQGTLLGLLQGHSDWVNHVAFHPDNQTLATAGYDKNVCLWNLHKLTTDRHQQGDSPGNSPGDRPGASRTIAPTRVLYGHDHTVTALRFSPDGELLASADSAGTLLLWSVIEGRIVSTLRGHSGWLRGLAFSPDGSVLASGSSDRVVRLWDIAQLAIVDTIHCSSEIWSLAFHPNGQALACGVLHGTVAIWVRTEHGESHRLATLYGNIVPIGTVAFSPDGTQLAAADENKNWVRIWQHLPAEDRWHSLRLLTGHTHVIRSTAFSPDGKRLATAGEDQVVRVWDVTAGVCRDQLSGHAAGLYSVAFAPDGTLLASTGGDSTIRLWDVTVPGTGRLQRILHGHKGVVYQLVFSPDGSILATVGEDHTLRLWNVSTGQTIFSMKGLQDYWSVAFNPSGEIFACGGRERVVHLLDMHTETRGKIIRTLRGHGGNILGLAFSPDGRTLVSGGEDGNVIIWDPDAGTELHRLVGNGQSVSTVSFHIDGKVVASGGFDGLLRLWRVENGTLQASLRPPGPYDSMNITGVTGISEARRAVLRALGAVEDG